MRSGSEREHSRRAMRRGVESARVRSLRCRRRRWGRHIGRGATASWRLVYRLAWCFGCCWYTKGRSTDRIRLITTGFFKFVHHDWLLFWLSISCVWGFKKIVSTHPFPLLSHDVDSWIKNATRFGLFNISTTIPPICCQGLSATWLSRRRGRPLSHHRFILWSLYPMYSTLSPRDPLALDVPLFTSTRQVYYSSEQVAWWALTYGRIQYI